MRFEFLFQVLLYITGVNTLPLQVGHNSIHSVVIVWIPIVRSSVEYNATGGSPILYTVLVVTNIKMAVV